MGRSLNSKTILAMLVWLVAGSLWAGALASVTSMEPVNQNDARASVSLISDNPCPHVDAGDIQVCGLPLRADDVARLHRYAECLAMRYHRESGAAVRTYVARQSADDLRALIAASPDCTPLGATRVSRILLEGALAERLVRDVAVPPSAGAPVSPGTAPEVLLVNCLMTVAPQDVAGLLRSKPLSPDEQQHMTALFDHLPRCLPAGVQLRTNPLALRSLISLGVFRAMAAPKEDETIVAQVPDGPLPTVQRVADVVVVARPTTLTFLPSVVITPPVVRDRKPMVVTLPHRSPDLLPIIRPEDVMANGAAFSVDPDTGDQVDFKPAYDKKNSNPY